MIGCNFYVIFAYIYNQVYAVSTLCVDEDPITTLSGHYKVLFAGNRWCWQKWWEIWSFPAKFSKLFPGPRGSWGGGRHKITRAPHGPLPNPTKLWFCDSVSKIPVNTTQDRKSPQTFKKLSYKILTRVYIWSSAAQKFHFYCHISIIISITSLAPQKPSGPEISMNSLMLFSIKLALQCSRMWQILTIMPAFGKILVNTQALHWLSLLVQRLVCSKVQSSLRKILISWKLILLKDSCINLFPDF